MAVTRPSRPRTRHRPSTAVLAALLAASVLSSCAGPSKLRDAELALAASDFVSAYWFAGQALEESPNSGRAQEIRERVRVPALIQTGQRLVFQDEDARAIGVLERALELDPDNAFARQWIAKARTKLAARANLLAERYVGGGQLEEAMAEYQRALDYLPGDPKAREGLDMVAEVWAGQQDKSRYHYVLGLRARADADLEVANYHFRVSANEDPTNEQAVELRDETALTLAREQYVRADAEQEAGNFRAALRDYERAAEVIRDDPELTARIASIRAEVEAEQLTSQAEQLLFKEEFAAAQERLEQAAAKSTLQAERIQDLLIVARERQAERGYRTARDLELQDQLQKALAGYREVESEFPDFQDTREVIDRLETTIEGVRTAYEAGKEAEEAGNLEKALEHYLEAVIAWPSYEDVKDRVERLRALQQTAEGL